jgi:quercetin dioxygenase-like cupin family protein
MSLNLSWGSPGNGPGFRGGRRAWAHAAGLGVTLALGAALGLAAAWYGIGTAPFPIEHHVLQASAEEPASAARPRSIQHPVACEKLPNLPGKSVTTVRVEFPPNALTPSHRHPGSVTAYVLKGSLRSQLDGGPVETFGVGGTWFEPPGTVHNMVENASATEPAELLAIFVADDDCGPLTIFDQ